jgi:hypothetical protein
MAADKEAQLEGRPMKRVEVQVTKDIVFRYWIPDGDVSTDKRGSATADLTDCIRSDQ